MQVRVSFLITTVVMTMLFCLTAFGQVTAALSGTVTDPNGAVVPGASVTVKSIATGNEFRAVTTSQGTYIVPSLNPGVYSLTVTATGFKSVTVEGIKIDTGTPANADVALELGAASETVVVQGGAEIVQVEPSVESAVGVTQPGQFRHESGWGEYAT
jgi:hypothetical protein